MSGSSVLHELVAALDERDLRAPAHEGLGHLQADVAAADHDHGLGTCARAGVVEQRLGVVERLHARGRGRAVDAGQVGAGRAGAGGDVELVEVERERAAGAAWSRTSTRARRQVDAQHLVVEPDVDAVLLAELLRACGRRGRRARRRRRRRGTGCRRPSSSSTRPSRGRRSPGRAGAAGPGMAAAMPAGVAADRPPAGPPCGREATRAPVGDFRAWPCARTAATTPPAPRRRGEVVQRCRVDAAEATPFACPEHCLFFEPRSITDAGWQRFDRPTRTTSRRGRADRPSAAAAQEHVGLGRAPHAARARGRTASRSANAAGHEVVDVVGEQPPACASRPPGHAAAAARGRVHTARRTIAAGCALRATSSPAARERRQHLVDAARGVAAASARRGARRRHGPPRPRALHPRGSATSMAATSSSA